MVSQCVCDREREGEKRSCLCFYLTLLLWTLDMRAKYCAPLEFVRETHSSEGQTLFFFTDQALHPLSAIGEVSFHLPDAMQYKFH